MEGKQRLVFLVIYIILAIIFFLQSFKLTTILDVSVFLGFNDPYVLLGMAATLFLFNSALYVIFSKPAKYMFVKFGKNELEASNIVETWFAETIILWLVFVVTIFSAGALYALKVFNEGSSFLNIYLFWFFISNFIKLKMKK